MPIAVGETINGLVDAFIGLPMVKTICGNPIYTSLFLGALVVLVILFVYRAEDCEKLLAFRAGFITIIASVCVMVVHNKILIDQESSKRFSAEVGDVYSNLGKTPGPVGPPPPTYPPPPPPQLYPVPSQ